MDVTGYPYAAGFPSLAPFITMAIVDGSSHDGRHPSTSGVDAPISVVIASAHPALVRMLHRFMRAHGGALVVGIAATATDAVDAAARLSADVVVLSDELLDGWTTASGSIHNETGKQPGIVTLTAGELTRVQPGTVKKSRITTDLMPAIRRASGRKSARDGV